jgi:hypothetical protein
MPPSLQATTVDFLNFTVPANVINKIWKQLLLTDLLRYAATSTANYDIVHNSIRDTVHRVLSLFCGNPTRFLDVLREAHAIVSGSVALYTLLNVTFGGSHDKHQLWLPSDMDVYIPAPIIDNPLPPFIAYMLNDEGYHIERRVDEHEGRGRYSLFPEVKHIFHLRKGSIRMDVIVSYTSFSLRPIFRFHSTPVMNCITGNGIFSAYPHMTLSHRGIVNPLAFTLNDATPCMPDKYVLEALRKYYERGFDIRRNPVCWPNNEHKCTRSTDCPSKLRSVQDSGCLYITLRSIGQNTGIGAQTKVLSRDVNSGEDAQVVWSLGGRSCDGHHSATTGFVSIRQEFPQAGDDSLG